MPNNNNLLCYVSNATSNIAKNYVLCFFKVNSLIIGTLLCIFGLPFLSTMAINVKYYKDIVTYVHMYKYCTYYLS